MIFLRYCSRLQPGRLVASVLLLLLAAASLSAQAATGLNFLVISDFGGKGGAVQRAVAEQMGRKAAEMGSKFVLTCGDNYHSNGIESADSPRWKTEFEDIYHGASLQIPWYPSLGNHDNRGSVPAEIAYSQKSARWKLPSRSYAHTEQVDSATDVLIVHLDTSPFVTAYRKKGSAYHVQDQDPQAQLKWLESTLAGSKARWKIVVGHHPIYSSAPAHGDTKELIKSVLPILEKYGVQMYFCGHDHVLEHLAHEPMNFFVCGGGSQHRILKQRADLRFGAESAGFLAMTLTGSAAEARFISDQGKELYLTKITLP